MLNKKWVEMTDEEKLKTIDPLLDNLKAKILSDKSLNFSCSADFGEIPDIRNGVGQRVKYYHPVTDIFTFNITRIRNT